MKDERPHVGNCVLNCGPSPTYPYLSHVIGIYPSHPETSMIHIWKPCTCWSAGRFVDERKSPLESLKPKHRNDEQHKYYAVCNIGIEYRYWTILNTWYYDKHLQTVQISIRIPIRLPRFGSRQLVKLPPWLDKKAANLATVGHDFTLVTPHLWEILWEDDLNWFDSILIWWLSIHDLLLLFLFFSFCLCRLSISCSSASF